MVVDDPLLNVLGLVLERRWQLVAVRKATLCRIHDHLACLLPGGANKHLTADKAAELRAIDRKIAPLDADIAWMLDEHGTTLTDIAGIGRTGAATILAITGDPARFRSAARSLAGRAVRRLMRRSPEGPRRGDIDSVPPHLGLCADRHGALLPIDATAVVPAGARPGPRHDTARRCV
jgi:transposase